MSSEAQSGPISPRIPRPIPISRFASIGSLRGWIHPALLAILSSGCGGGAEVGIGGEAQHVAADEDEDAFVAGPRRSGEVTITLRPTEAVQAGAPVLVTFGVPFPEGSIEDPLRIRVEKDGGEIPAYVDVAAPWRRVGRPGEGSIRVARVQLRYTFTSTWPDGETLTVAWGGTPRHAVVQQLEPVRSGWHTVTHGSFVAADGVEEPDVYALLPPGWASDAGLSMRMAPFDPGVPEARMDPTAFLAVPSWPGFALYDQASMNFFYSVINRDDPNVAPDQLIPYKTVAEPWLYDRAGTYFHLYLRSGFFTALREAVQAADFYKDHLYRPETPGLDARNVGLFDLRAPDPGDFSSDPRERTERAMYSYAEPMAFLHWLTGDDGVLEYVPWVVSAYRQQAEPTRWSPDLPVWTERGTALRLYNEVLAFELTGAAEYGDAAQTIVEDFLWHQDGAGGAFPPGTLDGALWHDGAQHGDGTGLIASPWMSALTVDAMLRAYLVTHDRRIADFLVRMGRFEAAASKVWPPEENDYGAPLRMPDFVTSFDGSTNVHETSDTEHAIDVAGALAWAAHFARGQDHLDRAPLRATALDLHATFERGVRQFTIPTNPQIGRQAYRVRPARKYNWQYHHTGAFGRLMDVTAQDDED
jgi:hypothetical protein